MLFQGEINFDTNGSRPDHVISIGQIREYGWEVYSCTYSTHTLVQVSRINLHRHTKCCKHVKWSYNYASLQKMVVLRM